MNFHRQLKAKNIFLCNRVTYVSELYLELVIMRLVCVISYVDKFLILIPNPLDTFVLTFSSFFFVVHLSDDKQDSKWYNICIPAANL